MIGKLSMRRIVLIVSVLGLFASAGLRSGTQAATIAILPAGPNQITIRFTFDNPQEISTLVAFLAQGLAGRPNGYGQGFPGSGAYPGTIPYGPYAGGVPGKGPQLLGINGGGMGYGPGPVSQGPGLYIPPKGSGAQQMPTGQGRFGGSPTRRTGMRVTSNFGPRGRGYHNGVDLGVPTGTQLFSLGDGQVSRTAWSDGGGWFIEVRYANGWKSRYLHMRDFNTAQGRMTQGMRVAWMQHIGHSNNTGSSTTGAHLHFELYRPDGNRVNPRGVQGITL